MNEIQELQISGEATDAPTIFIDGMQGISVTNEVAKINLFQVITRLKRKGWASSSYDSCSSGYVCSYPRTSRYLAIRKCQECQGGNQERRIADQLCQTLVLGAERLLNTPQGLFLVVARHFIATGRNR